LKVSLNTITLTIFVLEVGRLLILSDKDNSVYKKSLKIPKGGNQKPSIEEGQKRKYKRTNNDLQNITQKTKDRATQTSLRPEENPGASEG
jgi:hypothetical protein